ncbi:asparaginyl-tRNA synthetase [Xylona heveae TC161]|uniref:asparagine--tRNA ligase n=1 Tax=Xylona heveae (strain CBS 132557 / TC161) TaxID=1328760 RepID=A0A165G5Q7_XYLHT|nr:asparaginyl-tRNA synthetase [Xylona heveae TC161]KZF21767.1 asparaginyl-tRNA synthetase [Xylona heveae TC161]
MIRQCTIPSLISSSFRRPAQLCLRRLHDLTSSKPSIASVLHSTEQLPQDSESSKSLTINGFIRSVRKQKRFCFAAVGDGSTVQPLQAVLTPAQAEGLSTGAAVTISGLLKRSPAGKQQDYELHASDVRTIGEADPASYPLQKKYHTAEFLRTMPHLRTRIPFNSLLLRLRSHSISRLTSFFADRNFVQVHPPIITSSDCEGAGEVFTVADQSSQKPPPPSGQHRREEPFFRDSKYLTVSTQLHLEALAQSVGNVWTLSPTFRAEKSDTARHLSEFYMLEVELSFVDKVGEVLDVVEDMLRDLAQSLQESRLGKELLQAKRSFLKESWPRITYTEAIRILERAEAEQKVDFEFKPDWNNGLQAEHEKYLAETVGKGSPVFVTDYPQAIKPFYMLPSASDETVTDGPTVACFDLLVPEICEVVGGSMREHRLQQLVAGMKNRGMAKGTQQDFGSLNWYVDLRKWGSVPHGGFGLGFDRLLAYLAGVSNIREIVTFPRWVGRCEC